ncbi:unnamed protein product [Peronospora destructor]|uniref:Protein kinase domain-containing protein n=1 Tax=Peronospora destructor TaxID=86335 RepID=A0AAV0UM60_9STRA|nr:unnamed protein product [Peronospora destructor]
MSNVSYDVVCTDGAAFARVLFKAHITVASSVAVLNAFVLVGPRALDSNELQADVLEGWLDVMEQTYREISFRSLKMKELHLVTKYLPYGSLEDNLRGNSSFSIDERTGMLKDAAAGLLIIHEGGFIHRDLAARNCLVDQGNHVRSCDFGLCRRVRSETTGLLMKDAVGPVRYMAPESLQPPHAFSYDSDVYIVRAASSIRPLNVRPMQEVLTALNASLASSQHASVAIAARTATATLIATVMSKSVSSWTNLHKQQDRSVLL